MKFDWKFIVGTLIIALLVVPILFNFLFMWESDWANGESSSWFTLYGNIFGGLTGGFFTYLALLLTFKEQKENKKQDMRPRIDIPHQIVEFIDSADEKDFEQVAIELNNIGGSIAKNIECKLSITNYDEVITALERDRARLNINILRARAHHIDDLATNEEGEEYIHLIILEEDGKQKSSLGSIHTNYSPDLIGTCIPLILNYEAKSHYLLKYNVSRWISYIVQNRRYTGPSLNENELFNFNLEIKYSSEEYGDFTDTFQFEWKFQGILSEDSQISYKYILECIKVN